MGATASTSFGTLLRRCRLAAGLTQAALAERAGLSERAVNDLERDPRRTPRLETVNLLAEALNLTPADRARLLAAARPDAAAPEHSTVTATLLPTRRQEQVAAEDLDAPTASSPVPLVPPNPPLSPSGQLPATLSPFVGRAHDVAAVCAQLRGPGIRLLTLTGPGGIGKTRLALQVATVLQGAFTDGACFVDLGSLTDPALVLPTIASALGIPESTHHSSAPWLTEALRTRELLLVLDNFEQVAAAAMDVGRLLSTCPTVTILVTSRVVLHLAREREYPVAPLTIPNPTQHPSEPSDLMTYDAVALFAQRARAVLPDFALTAANARVIADICVRLEGVPLAIELAAARIKVLPPATLLERLDQQLTVLTGGPQDAPERQRTVRATLDWSYGLLSPEQQALFRRLAVFAGGWTLDAVEGICPGNGAHLGTGVARSAILDVLGHLVDHSLVLVRRHDDTVRYHLLETVRQYALEALQGTGEEGDLRDRHLEWFLQVAEDIESKTWIMPFAAALSTLQPEEDNFRAALAWSRQRDASGQATLRLAGALTILWQAVGAVNEGRSVLRDALARADPTVRTSAWARALMAAGDLASLQTDPAGASPQLDEALAIFEELGDDRNLARALTVAARVWHWTGDDQRAFSIAREKSLSVCRALGNLRALCETLWLWADLTLDRGDYLTARRQLEECLLLCRQLNDTIMLTFPLISLARVACAEGDASRARLLAEEALALRAGAPRWLLAIALNSLGEVERCADCHERAADLFTQALLIFRAQDDRAGIAWSLHNLGHVALRARDGHRAAELFAEALLARRQHGYAPGIASELAGMAGVCCLVGAWNQAARVLGAAEAQLESSQSVLAPADVIVFEHIVAKVRANLDASKLDKAWAAGRTCPAAQVIAEVLRIPAGS